MAKIALFIPCYNEARRLNVSAFKEFVLKYAGLIDFYFIDDGSIDNTSKIIKEHLLFSSSCTLLSTGKNLGKGNALIFGISKVDSKNYEYLGFIDSDGDIQLDQILKLHQKIIQEDALLAISNRNFKPNFKLFYLRSYMSVIMVKLANYLIGYELEIKDTQCGCKMFSSALVEPCFQQKFVSEWLFDIEMFIRFKKQFQDSRQYIVEVPLICAHNMQKSRSKLYSTHRILQQLYKIKRNYR